MRNKINRPAMRQLENVLWAIDKAHTVPQRVLDCGPGWAGLNQVYGLNCLKSSAQSICGKNNILTRCTNGNQFNIPMTACADVRKGQTDMSDRGEHQTQI